MCCDSIDLSTAHYDPNDITIGVGVDCNPLADMGDALGRALINMFTSPGPPPVGGAAAGRALWELVVP